jgi:hypothetical protein
VVYSRYNDSFQSDGFENIDFIALLLFFDEFDINNECYFLLII